jgi:hypothetical protein
MKKVVFGGPVRAIAFPQADAGLPDTTPLNRAASRRAFTHVCSAQDLRDSLRQAK